LEKIVLLKTDVFAVVICDHVVDIVVSQLKIGVWRLPCYETKPQEF